MASPYKKELGAAISKVDTFTDIPTSGLSVGDLIYTIDSDKYYKVSTPSTVVELIFQTAPTIVDPAIVITAKNITGSTMTKGQSVYISGADTARPTLTLAKADVNSTSFIHGIVTETITSGTTGVVQKSGSLKNVDTSAFAAGDALWLSAATAGLLTNTQPANPNVRMRMGVVLVSHATTGEMLLDVQALPVTSTEQLVDSTNKRFLTDAQQSAIEARSTLGSDISTTSTSYVDATGLSFAVAANTDYIYLLEAIFQSSAGGQGIGLAVNGPASPTSIVGLSNIPITLNTSVSRSFRAYNSSTPSTGVDTINTDNFGRMNGIFRNGANAGTFQVRYRADTTNTVTLKAGTVLRYRAI